MNKPNLNIGVLDLQGAVSEHLAMLQKRCDVQAVAVKKAYQLADLDGLIIPGGESTTISRLINQNELVAPIKQFAKQGRGVFGTCAGLVLCGTSTMHNEVEQLKLIDITFERNGFGRQINSFEINLDIDDIGDNVPAIFIRAPYIKQAGDEVKQMAFIDGHCVMARKNNILVCSFHPELTQDDRIMRYFLDMC